MWLICLRLHTQKVSEPDLDYKSVFLEQKERYMHVDVIVKINLTASVAMLE